MNSERTIKEILWDEEYIEDPDLSMLSGIGLREFEEVKSIWDLMNDEPLVSILSRLKVLADTNIRFDFSTVFKSMLLHESEQVKLKAIDGLWENEDRSLIAVFTSFISKDESQSIRLASADCLEKLLERSRVLPYPKRHMNFLKSTLLKILSEEIDSPQLLRQRALEMIGYFDGEEINTLIKDAFFSDNIRVKSSSIRAMGISSNPIWLSLILSDLDDVYPSITVSSIEAVGMLGDGDYANWLMKYLSDEDVDIQIASVKSLGIIGNEVARGAILQFVDELQESDEELDDDLLAAINVAIQAMDFDESPLDMQVDYKDYLQ